MSPGANIETNSEDATAFLEATEFDEDDLLLSLDIKSSPISIQGEEAFEITLKELHFSDEVLEIPRSAMNSILKLAVTKAHFKCKKIWYFQLECLAMGASLAVIFANLLIKFFKVPCRKQMKAGRRKPLI